LVQFAGWVNERLSAAFAAGEVELVESELAFRVYFSLYFTTLVAGLRGAMTRTEQVRFVRAALVRFFRLDQGQGNG
jgi:hypothetical protein